MQWSAVGRMSWNIRGGWNRDESSVVPCGRFDCWHSDTPLKAFDMLLSLVRRGWGSRYRDVDGSERSLHD